MAVHIGTSGWSYDGWQGIVYPHRSSSRQRLAHFVKRFATVEVNNSFYGWPKDETFDAWSKLLPDRFVMSLKAARELTHYRRLQNPQDWMTRMTESMLKLGPNRGVLLLQLPPTFAFNAERLQGVLQHASPELKLAFEFRHVSWDRDETYALLKRHKAAYCVMSGTNLSRILRVTAPFAYVRFHGSPDKPLYGGSYSDAELREWADILRGWHEQGREVFAYFNNDASGNAVANAETLRSMVNEADSNTVATGFR
jgi:uncharacterized protein YecE (DUF72 family)